MRIHLFISLAGVIILLIGCIIVPLPHTSKRSPEIDGCVVDSRGKPVEGALIELQNRKAFARDGEDWIAGARTKTRADGRFHLGSKFNVHLLWYANPSFQFSIPGGAYWTGRLVVRREGFYTRWHDTGSTTNGQVGELHLTPSVYIPTP